MRQKTKRQNEVVGEYIVVVPLAVILFLKIFLKNNIFIFKKFNKKLN